MRASNSPQPFLPKVVPTLIGGLLGLAILHPYTMLVYRLLMDPAPLHGFMDAWCWILHSFALHMWPMSSFFLLFGAMFGYGIGVLWEKRKELIERNAENERRKAIQETLQEITLTVAHWVRNANALIGGMTRRLMDTPPSASDFREKLALIRSASDQIEAVVASLQELDKTVEKEWIGKTQLRMLDIRDALSQKLREFEQKQT